MSPARDNRPLLADGNPAEILQRLIDVRYPIYAEADVIVDCVDESPDATTSRVLNALLGWRAPRRLSVVLSSTSYDLVIGDDLLARAGALLAPRMEQKRAVVVTDETVARLHLPALLRGLEATAVDRQPDRRAAGRGIQEPGELAERGRSVAGGARRAADHGDRARRRRGRRSGGLRRRHDAARAAVRAGADHAAVAGGFSSVGGKTAVNTPQGKNLVGAFYQPRMVLADTGTLATLPPRELRAGYAEIAKAGLIGDAAFFAWCEANGAAVVGGNREAQAEAIMRACAFKAAVVGDDEREEKPNDGRALLNLGHTFGHALEAEYGYGGGLLHGEGVAVGLGLAFRLSARLGHCARGGRGPRGVACRGDGHAGRAAHAEPAVLRRDADRAHAARQEGARRGAAVRAGARGRADVHRAATCRRRR